MSTALPFSEDHRDCLQELCNIAMGAAGESLASFAKLFVNLSIPKIRYIEPTDITEALSCLSGEEKISSAAQHFKFDDHGGYALVVISEPGLQDLAQSANYSLNDDHDAEKLLLDLTRTINDTCLPYLAELMETALETLDTKLVNLRIPVEEFQLQDIDTWPHAVSVEINYHLEGRPFNCDLLLLLPDAIVDALTAALNRLLED